MARALLMVIRDLNRFLNLFRKRGFKVEEGTHAVLTDGSEVGSWRVLQGDKSIAEILSHYVDSHYYELIKLPDDAEDRKIIEALIRAEAHGLWRVPVEPVLLLLFEESAEELLRGYSDEYPSEEAREAARHYLEHHGARVLKNFVNDLLTHSGHQDRI